MISNRKIKTKSPNPDSITNSSKSSQVELLIITPPQLASQGLLRNYQILPDKIDKYLLLDMNRILLSGIFILVSLSSLAQTSVGIRGGYSTSTYSYRPTPSTRATSVEGIDATTFALVFEHFNAKNAGIEVNLQLLRMGFAQSEEGSEPLRTNETQFDYLKIPMLSSFFLGRSGRFQIKLGPHLGYLLQAKDINREFSDATPPEIPTYGGSEDKPRKIMYGLTAGAGISKLFGKSTIAGEVRFSYDFTNPEGQERIFDMSSTNLEFTLAYLFRIKESKSSKVVK